MEGAGAKVERVLELAAISTNNNTVTSLTLFKSLSLPILSFGLEIWIPTDTELLLMERCQLKILRTILGLPTRSPSAGIHLLLGTIPVQVLSQLRRLSFIQSTAALPDSAIAKRLFLSCANSPSPGSLVHELISTLDFYCLPNVPALFSEPPSKFAWKALCKTMLHDQYRDDVQSNAGPAMAHILSLPFSKYGHPSTILHNFRHDLSLARLSLLRVRFLLHVTSLYSHTSSFHSSSHSDTCNCSLCDLDSSENIAHFITVWPSPTTHP